MFGGCDSELVVKGVVQYLGHVVPVVDDAVLDGVGEFEDALLGLRLLAHECIGFLADCVPITTHDGGEGSTGSIIAREAGFTHACSAIYHHSSLFHYYLYLL
jgi:hypothetical protein